jgi:hypothetical protein
VASGSVCVSLEYIVQGAVAVGDAGVRGLGAATVLCPHSSNFLSNRKYDIEIIVLMIGSRDNSVGVATGYGLDGRGLILGTGKKFFSSPQHPGRKWGLLSLLFNECRGPFPGGKAAGA